MNSKTDIITLSTQPYTKSSCQLDLTHFHPINSTLNYAWLQASQNEKIREPEKNSQLSEMPCFQAFFGIYFCTLVINTTHSTCPVLGNKSTGCTFCTSYPFFCKAAQSLAAVAGWQEIITIRLGCIFPIASNAAVSHPFLGGSTTITSGCICSCSSR